MRRKLKFEGVKFWVALQRNKMVAGLGWSEEDRVKRNKSWYERERRVKKQHSKLNHTHAKSADRQYQPQ